MIKLVALALVAVGVVSTARAADRSADQYREVLAGHLAAWRLSEVLEIGAEAVARHPEHAELRYLYGVGLRRSLYMDEAAGQLERARALDPDNPDIAMVLARTHASLGNLEEAASLARAAAGRDPGASELARTLAVERRIRAGTAQAPEPGGALAFTDRFLSALSRDRLESALARYGDPDAFDRIIHEISGQATSVNNHDRRRFIAQTATILAAAWDNEFGERGTSYRGYELQALDTLPSGAVVASGVMLVTRTYSSVPRDELFRALEAEQPDMDTDTIRAFHGLDPRARDAFVARLAGITRSIHVPFSVYMHRTGETGWAIFDVSFGEPPMYVSELARHSWELSEARATTAEANRRDLVWSIAIGIAEAILLVIVLAAVIFVLRRKLRR